MQKAIAGNASVNPRRNPNQSYLQETRSIFFGFTWRGKPAN
jgi:hypothetical protein